MPRQWAAALNYTWTCTARAVLVVCLAHGVCWWGACSRHDLNSTCGVWSFGCLTGPTHRCKPECYAGGNYCQSTECQKTKCQRSSVSCLDGTPYLFLNWLSFNLHRLAVCNVRVPLHVFTLAPAGMCMQQARTTAAPWPPPGPWHPPPQISCVHVCH